MARNVPRNFDFESKKDWVRHNEQIRIPKVLVIHNGKNLGIMHNRAALELARSVGLDLVEVSPNSRPPVCHILDYGKYMFDKQKKQKQSKSNKAAKEKEVEFRYVIGDGDLLTKVNQVKGFLSKGYKVKCVCKFMHRENAHKDQGFKVLNKVLEMLKDVSIVDFGPKFDGSNLVCKLSYKNKTS